MSLRDRCSAAFVGAASMVQRLSHGLLFMAGGARNAADFQRGAAAYFADFNAHPHEIAGGFNALEARVYARHLAEGGRVCVVGCGTGRDLLPFIAAGHETVGVEPSGQSLDVLRRALDDRGATAVLIHGFVEDAGIPGTFDLIVLSPHCYSYIPGSRRRVAVLEKLATHLRPGGRIAINFLRRQSGWSTAGVRLASLTSRLSGSDYRWEPHDVPQLVQTARGRAITFQHFFLPSEIAGEAVAAGLRVIEADADDFLGPLTVVGR